MAQNYVLGRGKIYFSRFLTGTQTPEGARYIGNTPEFSLTIESEVLDHFSSDAGIREKDDSVPLEVTRSGSLITDNIDPENVALFFYGEKSLVTKTLATSQTYTVTDAIEGRYYQVGRTAAAPAGVRGLTSVVVKVGVTTKTLTTDYTINVDTGQLYIVEGGGINTGDDVIVEYSQAAVTYDRVISGSEPIEGALTFVAENPKGNNADFYMPWVKITPNGDYALKGDEWQQIPFTLEILKPTTSEAIYQDGRPAYS
jgi:hypothetical protein